jgi:hypothetical protein
MPATLRRSAAIVNLGLATIGFASMSELRIRYAVDGERSVSSPLPVNSDACKEGRHHDRQPQQRLEGKLGAGHGSSNNMH